MGPLAIPEVQDALEAARQDAHRAVDETLGHIAGHNWTLTEAARMRLINSVRKAATLDTICAEHGVTTAVMARI